MSIRTMARGFPGGRAMASAVVVALTLAGCGKKDAERPAGQVIAHIGPDDVTVQELENEFRLAKIPLDKRNDALTSKVLLEIVTRKAIARQAMAAKIDREPTFRLDQLREKERMLEGAFLQRKLAGQVVGISQSDIDQFIAAHPAQFAKRVIFATDQVEIPAQSVSPAVAAATKDAKTLQEVEQKLNEIKVGFRPSTGALDSAVLPPQMTQQLQMEKANDVFFVRAGAAGVFFKVSQTQAKPLSGPDAAKLARELMTREMAEKLNRQTAHDAASAATYEGDYAKIMKDQASK